MKRAYRSVPLTILAAAVLTAACGGGSVVLPTAEVDLAGYRVCGRVSENMVVIATVESLTYGYANLDGEIVVPPILDLAGPFSEGLATVEKNPGEGVGYIDRGGEWAIEPRFDRARPFSDGLAAVQIDRRFGYIDRNGDLRIPALYDNAFGFSEGRARVVVDGRIGLIDEHGEWVVQPTLHKAGDFHDGLAFVCDRSLCGFVDLAGEPVIGLRFDDAGSFSHGLAPVHEGGKWGYVDIDGGWVVEPVYDEAHEFADGLALVAVGDMPWQYRDYLFIDTDGAIVLEPDSYARSFSGGIAVIRVPGRGFCTDCSEYRLMRTDGSLLPGRFVAVGDVSGGLAVVTVDPDRGERRSFVIDTDGAARVAFDDSAFYGFDLEDAGRRLENARFGFIGTDGETVIPHEHFVAHPYSDGVAYVEGPTHDRGRRFIDHRGSSVIELPKGIYAAAPFSDGTALVRDNQGHHGYIDRTGEMVIPPSFDTAFPFSDGLAAVKPDRRQTFGGWGYIDRDGVIVIESRFSRAAPFLNGLAYVEWSGETHWHHGLIDTDGRVVVEEVRMQRLAEVLDDAPRANLMQRLRAFSFAEGLFPCGKIDRMGYVDGAGAFVLETPELVRMELFSEGLAAVAVERVTSSEPVWGYADPSGEVVIEPRFEEAGPFSEGLALVRDRVGRTGYITLSGAWAVEPIWLDEADAFSEGLAMVKLNGFFGYLDRDGRFAIPPRFTRAEPFSEGLAATGIDYVFRK